MSAFRFKVVVAGDEAVGKSSCIRRFMNNTFSDSYKATLGFEVSVKVVTIGSATAVLSIFDVAGQRNFAPIRKGYYNGANGFILLFDLTKRETFDHLVGWVGEIRAVAPVEPIVLVGNKKDLPSKAVTLEQIAHLRSQIPIADVVLGSAKTGEGIQDMFQKIGSIIVNLRKPPPPAPSKGVNMPKQ